MLFTAQLIQRSGKKAGKRYLFIVFASTRALAQTRVHDGYVCNDLNLLRLSEGQPDRDGIPSPGEEEAWVWDGRHWWIV